MSGLCTNGPAERAVTRLIVSVMPVARGLRAVRRRSADRAVEIARLGTVEHHARELRADAHQSRYRFFNQRALLPAGDGQHDRIRRGTNQ